MSRLPVKVKLGLKSGLSLGLRPRVKASVPNLKPGDEFRVTVEGCIFVDGVGVWFRVLVGS